MGEIIKIEKAKRIREKARKDNKRVVFTNGCFDIIHRGHIEYLSKAKALGDILIIGLNTDKSARKIKGKGRPLVNENDRALILSSLVFVDYVILFDELTPQRLINDIKPDVLVKGGDYRINEIVGRKTVWREGGKVITIDEVPGYSTTKFIQKLKRNGVNPFPG
jgi:rfaE bifunctional protein nucleotidyltransferase chain/domain